jgi:hypothetical protein
MNDGLIHACSDSRRWIARVMCSKNQLERGGVSGVDYGNWTPRQPGLYAEWQAEHSVGCDYSMKDNAVQSVREVDKLIFRKRTFTLIKTCLRNA